MKPQVVITSEENDAKPRRERQEDEEPPAKGHRHYASTDIKTKPDADMEPGENKPVTYSWEHGPSHGTDEEVVNHDASGMH